MNGNELTTMTHHFIIYSFMGGFLAFTLIIATNRFFKWKKASTKAAFYSIPLFAPIVSIILIMTGTIQSCLLEQYTRQVWYLKPLSEFICSAGDFLAVHFGWIVFFAIGLAVMRFIIGQLYYLYLKRKFAYNTEKLYPEASKFLHELARDMQVKAPSLIVLPQKGIKAFTFGVIKPIIVVTEGFLNLLTDSDREIILIHELAHIKQKDSMGNWLMLIMRDLLFFSPAAYWTFRKYVAEKEQACDALVIQKIGHPVLYGKTLLKVFGMNSQPSKKEQFIEALVPTPRFLREVGMLEDRIKRILMPQQGEDNKVKVVMVFITMFTMVIISNLLLC